MAKDRTSIARSRAVRAVCAGLMALTIGIAGLVLPTRWDPGVRADTVSMVGPMPVYEQLVRRWLGASGNLRAVMATADANWLAPWLETAGITPSAGLPGVHLLKWTAPDGLPLVLLALTPFDFKHGGFVGGYHVGRWPAERHPATAMNPVPEGFIEVTPENQDTFVSTRFRLRDFITHDQDGVWPKYLVLRPELLDKLELIAQELEREGRPSRIEVLSGFRSPQYNARATAGPGGRMRDSQHMYGDAADIYVDADGDGRMDDLDGDGRVTVKDAEILVGVAEKVEAQHPELVGGLAAYRSTGSHGPFVHVDARGWRARW
jgi:hypothetical protein